MSTHGIETSSQDRSLSTSGAASPLKTPSMPRISMYLGQSMYWWAYLGIRSNLAIRRLLEGGFDQAIFFDDPCYLSEIKALSVGHKAIFFFIFWDGLNDRTKLLQAESALGPAATIIALVVGDVAEVFESRYQVQNLYPPGPLAFDVPMPPLDARSRKILRMASFKCWIMPLKNIWQNKDDLAGSIRLLAGKRKLVFCGVFGTLPAVLKEVCERHLLDFSLFEKYKYFCDDPDQSVESLNRYLRSSGVYLANLYSQQKITPAFLLTIVHLLGREYFIRQMQVSGMEPFINGYGIGKRVNVNVYGTPFYAQHVFIDFGSQSVGSGNYPRLANLRYFKKKVFEVDLNLVLEKILPLAEAGTLDEHFEPLWTRNAPALFQSIH